MENLMWTVYNGHLIYRKRKGGLWYDLKTGKKLSPQPNIK